MNLRTVDAGEVDLRLRSVSARIETSVLSVEGESVRKWLDFGTDNKAAARRKLARLAKELAETSAAPEQLSVSAGRHETASEAAIHIFKERESDVLVNDPIRFKKHDASQIGKMIATAVKSYEIRDVLDQAKEQNKSRRTLTHIRRVMNLSFDLVWRDECISENPVARAKVPNVATDNRERAVLNDDELVRYLGWQHPEEHHGMAVLERQVMACISRCFGGLRTGDMQSLRWESLDTTDGRFKFGWAPRKKTARPQLLEIPEMLRPLIRDWWERAGKPATRLLFAARRGEHAGSSPKIGVSHAVAFRRDLRRTFGVDAWDPVTHRFAQDADRELSPRERELFEDTPYTKPVDFHSWRRAYSQPLANAGASAQQDQTLAAMLRSMPMLGT